MPAIQRKACAPPGANWYLCAMFAPSDFEADGYKGNMSSWENYGKFIYQLVKTEMCCQMKPGKKCMHCRQPERHPQKSICIV